MRVDDRTFGLLLLLGAAASCGIKTNQVSIGQKTTLERQLMGNVEPLSEEELLVASVRGAAASNPTAKDEQQQRALAARRRQIFNRDDLDELRGAGCLGEARDARLVARPCDKPVEPALASLQAELIGQENDDRQAIIDWALATDPQLTAADRGQVVQIYRRLLLERLRPGDWLEQDDGSWARR